MHDAYVALVRAARRVFERTGVPIPRVARRLNHYILTGRRPRHRSAAQRELEAQARAIQRLETMAYIDRLGKRDDP